MTKKTTLIVLCSIWIVIVGFIYFWKPVSVNPCSGEYDLSMKSLLEKVKVNSISPEQFCLSSRQTYENYETCQSIDYHNQSDPERAVVASISAGLKRLHNINCADFPGLQMN